MEAFQEGASAVTNGFVLLRSLGIEDALTL
jgi:hypothetical protein